MNPLRVELLPILDDNYVFILIDDQKKECIVVDPGEAGPVKDYLREKDYRLLGILLTHHHNDHIGGVHAIMNKFVAPVYAPTKNKEQIADGTRWVSDGDEFQLGAFQFSVMALPGHTLGHVAYWFHNEQWLFSGDVLFGLGCGRLFEGTPEQMYDSLNRIKMLPPRTKIFCTHEYTESNLRFSRQLQTQNLYTGLAVDLDQYAAELKSLRQSHEPSVPLRLLNEMKCNPFLLANSVEEFTKLRMLRNQF